MGNEIYNAEYAQKYAALAATPLGQAIYASRWALILKYVQKGNLLDYGSGPGAFNAHGPSSFNRLNYDVNPTCGFTKKLWLPQTKEVSVGGTLGIEERDGEAIDVLTMWDSIEHIPNFYGEIQDVNAPWLFITTPNLESVDKPIFFFKHYRPGEHIYYFDRHSLGVILDDLGYRIREFNFDEGKLRDPEHPSAILTVVAQKSQ
jgi:hypothetical protein